MPDVELITTSDGSHSLRHFALDETYHSIHGAVRESEHVFIKNGLCHLESNRQPGQIRILEIGFGTGLNALLTAQHTRGSTFPVHYTSLEAFPLAENIWRELNYPVFMHLEKASAFFSELHNAAWDVEIALDPNFVLLKKNVMLQEWNPQNEKFDLVYFDAFAPGKQPEMWELSLLGKVVQAMQPGAVWVTYCAKGQLKRDLKSLGLQVETLPGPPGKKEMVRATKS